jgi:hypothetical protein
VSHKAEQRFEVREGDDEGSCGKSPREAVDTLPATWDALVASLGSPGKLGKLIARFARQEPVQIVP